MNVQEARKQLEVEVRDCMYQPPLDNKNEGWISSTMGAADDYALAVLDELTAVDAGLCCPADAEFVESVRAKIQGLGKEEASA